MIAILLNGPPTAGKGVRGIEMEKYLNANRILTSTALEEDGHAEKMRKGDMVEDHIVFQSVTSRVVQGVNHIFDGFARTPEQATIFPKELRKLGFTSILTVELSLIDEEKALERRLKRKQTGDSNDRPDGDRKETFLKRFHRHNNEADKVRSILVHSCDHLFVIDTRKNENEIARLIKGYLRVALVGSGVFNTSEEYDFMGDFNPRR
jgi:adenylate kinase family enzyme